MTAPGPDLRIGSRAQPAFRLFALAGLAAGIATALAVDRVPPAALAVTVAGGMLAALGVLALRVVVTGRGDLVWSEHEAAVLAVAVGVGTVTHHVAPLLDAVALGLAVMLATGRIGCLLAGCCHGRPARRGVRYGPAHAAEGFPAALVGVPLVPVQAVEAVWAATLALGGLVLLGAAAPGVTAGVVVAGRAGGRFVLEALRGDEGRGRGRLTRPRLWALALGAAAMVGTVLAVAAG